MPLYKYRDRHAPYDEIEVEMKMSEKDEYEFNHPWLERVIEPVAFGDLTALRKAHD